MPSKKERRGKYLVNKPFQLELAFLLMLQAAIPIIIIGGCLLIVNKTYLATIQKLVGSPVLSDTYIRSVVQGSAISIVASLVMVSGLLIFIGIRFSHHVAGPLYKLQKSMEELARGERVEPLNFRETDIAEGLSRAFNDLAKKMNQKKNG